MAKRVCVVGLDGMPHGLLTHLADSGVMPNVAERIASGHLRPMRASLPEISSVSWTSFMTGANPGRHGVFGFTDLKPHSYDLRFPGFNDVDVPTLWDHLGLEGLTSVVLNQPSTYPARSIPGVLVSGFVALDLSRAVRPLRFIGPLRRLGYRIDIDTLRARRDRDHLFVDLQETLATRRAALFELWDQVRWDFLQVVITGTDRLYHFAWDALFDEEHPQHARALEYHRAVDALIGEIWARLEREVDDPTAGFWMLSDHGFCAIEQEVQLNAWLRQEGFLVLGDGPADGLDAIAGESVAFALDPGRIHVHRSGRYPRGTVAPEGVQGVKKAVAESLRALRYDGKLVVREVFDAAEIYDGPCVERGPDLVVLAHPGFDLKASPAATDVFGRTDLVGMHTYDDAFVLTPKPLGGDLWIGDLAQHLLREFGL